MNREKVREVKNVFQQNFVTALAIGLTSCIWCSGAAAKSTVPLDTPERINVLVTYGGDECPESQAGEIVVCAQRPESERYRIPKELREVEEEEPGEQSWTSVVASHDEAARAGRPNSCSVVGSFGFSGCQAAIMRKWFDERRDAGN
ncbi:MAG: hypothetical protein V7679_06530 [Parasphingorhabdus sp.]